MLINNNLSTSPIGGQIRSDGSVDEKFLSIINSLYQPSFDRELNETIEGDAELNRLKDELLTKGSARFLKDLNDQKIEELVEKFKAELEAQQVLNPENSMDIEQMVLEFRKELIEQLKLAKEAEQIDKSDTIMSFDFLENLQNIKSLNNKKISPETSYLNQLLHYESSKEPFSAIG